MRDVTAASWRAVVAGVLLVGAGVAAIVAASIQGMALVPGGSILDGYDVGLLPWMEVGAWLVPIGAVVATIAGITSVWLGRSPALLRIATIPAILTVLFWGLLAVLGTAPHSGPSPNGSTATSSLATFVYSAPATTIDFLLIPATLVVLLAAVARRRPG